MQQSGGANPRETCKRILIKTVDASLLPKFTYSGLGEGRRRTKYSFSSNALCPIIEGQYLMLYVSKKCGELDDLATQVIQLNMSLPSQVYYNVFMG